MEQQEYINQLEKELQNHKDRVILQLRRIIGMIPEKANELTLDIHPGQENDGYFEIQASLEGPDLFTLNKQIEDVASIFDVKYGANGFEPPIPMVDSDSVDWDVYLVSCKTSMEWLKKIWDENFQDIKLPTSIVVADDFGNVEPIELN